MADLQRTDSFQYPAAHLGHLSPAQQSAFDQFKELCQKEGYYQPAEVSGSREASHDDETLLRFLRARRFNPPEALKQFRDTEIWRKENHLDELYETIDVTEYEESRRLYPQWTGRRDKRGIPVYLFKVAHLTSKTVSAYEKSTANAATTVSHTAPARMLRLFALYENLTRFVMPLCSAIPNRNHPETPISQSNNIVDISGVGLKQFWNLKGHMQDASTLATAHYPETLDRIFIIGAPSFFPTVWGWIKRWFDPVTVSKIFILSSSNMESTLKQYIDPQNIPKQYGGELDFDFGMMPVLEPEIDAALKWETPSIQGSGRTIPTGPIKWEQAPDGRIQAIAVGSQNGKARREVIATLNAPDGLKAMHGGSIRNTPIPESELAQLGTGTSTHPADDGTQYTGNETPPSDSSSSNAPTEKSLPIRTREPGTRVGTSDTRLQQEEHTHAQGQMANGTPDIDDHGHGDKTVTMEPRTVGQAPKEMPKPEPQSGDASIIDQAKAAATEAYETAASAAVSAEHAVLNKLGYGSEEAEKPSEDEQSTAKSDPALDNVKKENLEEVLRDQYHSRAGMK